MGHACHRDDAESGLVLDAAIDQERCPVFCIKVQQLPADVFNGRSAHAVDGVCVRFARVVQRNLCVDP